MINEESKQTQHQLNAVLYTYIGSFLVFLMQILIFLFVFLAQSFKICFCKIIYLVVLKQIHALLCPSRSRPIVKFFVLHVVAIDTLRK